MIIKQWRVLIVVLCSSIFNGETKVSLAEDTVSVVSIDFTFDNGSLLFELQRQDEVSYWMIVHPKSDLRGTFGKGANFLRSKTKQFQRDGTTVQSEKELAETINGLFEKQNELTLRHRAVLGYLLARAFGREPILWGNDAVASLEKGNWIACFQQANQMQGKVDESPF
jgi:hypothetical protein